MPLPDVLRRLRRRLFPVRPRRVVLEPTNRCNLNCPFCMVGLDRQRISEHGSAAHDAMTRPLGRMSQDLFDRIKGELAAFGIRKVLLHFQGEPFLNPLTPSFARSLKVDGFEVGVFTNGLVFSDESLRELASARVDLIRFSVDGGSEESYGQNRVGGSFTAVVDAMRRAVRAHEGLPTRIEWQFLPLRNNEHEVPAAAALAREIGVHFFTKGFRETDPALAPQDPAYRAVPLRKPCTDIYAQLGIYWNGDVVPCCYDVDGSHIMGNLTSESLSAIWASSAYVQFRRRVGAALANPDAEPPLCRRCLRWGTG